MQKFKCHKVVHAARITAILQDSAIETHLNAITLSVEAGGGDTEQVIVPGGYQTKHSPEVGGYYVRYEDGYESYSPAGAFEAGYTRVSDLGVEMRLHQEHILQFFQYGHLPERLQAISRPFAEMAMQIMERPRNPERTVALRKLLESKDAAVRAELAGELLTYQQTKQQTKQP